MVAFARLAVADTSEPFQLIDIGKLEGACTRPRNHWTHGETNIGRLAALLLLGVAQAHPFIQGNKRAGMIAANAMLLINGRHQRADDDGLGLLILYVLRGEIDEAEFIDSYARDVRSQRRRESVGGQQVYRSSLSGRFLRKR